MANEFKHKDPCTTLTQCEYIGSDGTGHVFASQATGDLVIADSATVLKRLARAGSGSQMLQIASCKPAWTATPCLGATSWANMNHAHGAACTGGTVCANVLAGTTLKSTVVTSSLETVGTLSALTVDDVAINGKVVTMTGSACDTIVMTAAANGAFSLVTTDAVGAAANIAITADGTVTITTAGLLTLDSGAAINIEPHACSAVLIDGTVSIDGAAITGATSILATDIKIGEDDQTKVDFADANIINLHANNIKALSVHNTSSKGELRFYEGCNYVGFAAPALSADQVWALPTVDGSCGQALVTDGSGALSWASAGGQTINNATANELVTIGATTTELCAEAELTYDGTDLKLMKGGASATGASLAIETYNDGGNPARMRLRTSKHDTQGTHGAMTSGLPLGYIQFEGSDGDSFERSVVISGWATQTWSGSAQGSRLEFYTTADCATSETLAMKINNTGEVTVSENCSTPSVTQGIAKSWANVGSDGSASDSYNASTGKDTTGIYAITFATGMQNVNYVISNSMFAPVTHTSSAKCNAVGSYKVVGYTNAASPAAVDIDFGTAVFGEAT
jgi:hypothetical protein